MPFNKQDFDSSTWRKLEAHLNELLAKRQRELENETLSVDKTASIRGRIKQIRQLLALRDKGQKPGPDSQD
jgi:hypothetical protein